MAHNPLVSVDAHPMLEMFPGYMQAVENLNVHGDNLMEMVTSFSPQMSESGVEIAHAVKEFHRALKTGDFVRVFIAKGAIYGIAAGNGMSDAALLLLKEWLDVYAGYSLTLAKIEQYTLASLN